MYFFLNCSVNDSKVFMILFGIRLIEGFEKPQI